MLSLIIGENIRKWRQFRGYQQPEFAEKISVSVVTLSKWENGRVDISISSLLKIASALEINLDDLLSSTHCIKSLVATMVSIVVFYYSLLETALVSQFSLIECI